MFSNLCFYVNKPKTCMDINDAGDILIILGVRNKTSISFYGKYACFRSHSAGQQLDTVIFKNIKSLSYTTVAEIDTD